MYQNLGQAPVPKSWGRCLPKFWAGVVPKSWERCVPRIWGAAAPQHLGRRGAQKLGGACPDSGNSVSKIWARREIHENATPIVKARLRPKVEQALPKRWNDDSGRRPKFWEQGAPKFWARGLSQLLGAGLAQLLGTAACPNSGQPCLPNF